MYNITSKSGIKVYVSTCDDCGENKGGKFCQVYLDEDCSNEIDSFTVPAGDDVESYISEYIEGEEYHINQQEAEHIIYDKLRGTDIGDKVYELAQELFTSYIDEIDHEYGIVVDNDSEEFDGADGEAWYDNIRETFFEDVYEKVLTFLEGK